MTQKCADLLRWRWCKSVHTFSATGIQNCADLMSSKSNKSVQILWVAGDTKVCGTYEVKVIHKCIHQCIHQRLAYQLPVYRIFGRKWQLAHNALKYKTLESRHPILFSTHDQTQRSTHLEEHIYVQLEIQTSLELSTHYSRRYFSLIFIPSQQPWIP